jgi:CheY-like chemotaxis protein
LLKSSLWSANNSGSQRPSNCPALHSYNETFIDVKNDLPTILLVDDDTSILTAWKRILQLEGFHVVTASDGRDALAVAKKVRPALVITDRSMPAMNGIELCQLLKSEPELAAIPVILASNAHNLPVDASIWDDFWQKPVLAETMISSITRLLGVAAKGV